MTIRDGDGNAGLEEPAFWGQLFAGLPAPVIVADGPGGSSTPQSETLGRRRKTWVDRLFAGEESYANSPDKIVILQNGVEIEDVPIDPLGSWTVVGRHLRAHIQLEAYKLGLFHAAFHKKDGRFYLGAIDLECGTLLDRKKIKAGVPVPLRDGRWSTSRAINCVSALPILRPPQGRRSSRPRNWRKFPPISMSRPRPLPARC